LSEGLSRGLAYHLNTSKVQDLGNLSPTHYGNMGIEPFIVWNFHFDDYDIMLLLFRTWSEVPFQGPQRQALRTVVYLVRNSEGWKLSCFLVFA
jgi:hypothetical protein